MRGNKRHTPSLFSPPLDNGPLACSARDTDPADQRLSSPSLYSPVGAVVLVLWVLQLGLMLLLLAAVCLSLRAAILLQMCRDRLVEFGLQLVPLLLYLFEGAAACLGSVGG